jgi:hypothetical protein
MTLRLGNPAKLQASSSPQWKLGKFHLRDEPLTWTEDLRYTMSGRTALITGATGFLGRQVVKAFASHDWTVKGTGFSRADGNDILKVDLANAAEIEEALEKVK